MGGLRSIYVKAAPRACGMIALATEGCVGMDVARADRSRGTLPLRLPAGDVLNARAQRFFDYWRSLPKVGFVPSRESFNPASAPPLLPDVILCRYESGAPPRVDFRLIGSRHVDRCIAYSHEAPGYEKPRRDISIGHEFRATARALSRHRQRRPRRRAERGSMSMRFMRATGRRRATSAPQHCANGRVCSAMFDWARTQAGRARARRIPPRLRSGSR